MNSGPPVYGWTPCVLLDPVDHAVPRAGGSPTARESTPRCSSDALWERGLGRAPGQGFGARPAEGADGVTARGSARASPESTGGQGSVPPLEERGCLLPSGAEFKSGSWERNGATIEVWGDYTRQVSRRCLWADSASGCLYLWVPQPLGF